MKYQGEFPNIRTHFNNADCINGMMSFALKYEADNSYGYKKWTSNPNTHKCPLCCPGSGKGWNCIGWDSAIAYHGGTINTVTCACNGMLYDSLGTNITLAKWRQRNGPDWNMISNGGSKGGASIKQSSLPVGAFLVCYNSSGTYKHMAWYMGNGYIIDATSSNGIKKRTYSALTKSLRVTRAFVYTGVGTGYRNYMKMGDSGAEVKKLQSFLNWALDLSLTVDGQFGQSTHNAVCAFQELAVGKGTGDGLFGQKTLDAAKAFDKGSPTPKKEKYPGPWPSFNKYLERGDKGTAVVNLQKFLNWALDAKLAVDGVYGAGTEAAVKQFQQKVGLKADGIFGKDSLAKAKEFEKVIG